MPYIVTSKRWYLRCVPSEILARKLVAWVTVPTEATNFACREEAENALQLIGQFTPHRKETAQVIDLDDIEQVAQIDRPWGWSIR